RQASFIAETLHLERRRRAREAEMVLPALLRAGEAGIHIGAVKHVAGAAGVDDALRRYRQRRPRAHLAGLVVPEQAALTERHAADAAAARLQVFERVWRREIHLLAEPLRHDGDVDEREKIERVGAHRAAVERRHDAGLPAQPRVMHRGVGLMAVEVEKTAAGKVERREGMEIAIVAAAQDGALALVRAYEGERR